MKKIVVIGSCGLDRMLHVSEYPRPDSKIRTTDYVEMGGGNATNVAVALARLAASADKKPQFQVKLCTKVGDDNAGKYVVDELRNDIACRGKENESTVLDIDHPLFVVCSGKSTGLTTILVSADSHTRTCIHTPGTCGELGLQDLEKCYKDSSSETHFWDTFFTDVVHLHTDSRHTAVSLKMAQEAAARKIPVSVDAEKDRKTPDLDLLLDVASQVFTNQQQIDDYLSRLTKQNEIKFGRHHLKEPEVVGSINDADLQFYARCMRPSFYFTRWNMATARQKEVVITKGDAGSILIRCEHMSQTNQERQHSDRVEVTEKSPGKHLYVVHSFQDRSEENGSIWCHARYDMWTSGVLTNVKVVDTTGAGDAFIAGFLFAQLNNLDTRSKLILGSWVAGRKVGGRGARENLPSLVPGLSLRKMTASLEDSICDLRLPSQIHRTTSIGSIGSWETA